MEPNSDTNQPQPTLTSAPPVSPITPTSKPKSRGMLFMGGILILGLGFTIGLLFSKNLSPISQTSPTPTPLLSPTPQAKPDLAPPDTANWKTYRNEKYGFLFRYPSEWEIQAREVYNERYHGEGFYFRTCSTSALAVSFLDLSRPDAVYKSVDDYLKTNTSYPPAIQWKDIYIAGIPGKYYKEIGDPGSVTPSARVVLFNKFKNSIIVLYFTDPCAKGIDKAIKNEFDQILSTFKFLGQGGENIYKGKYFTIDTSTWKLLSDANQSPATPEVLETVLFENGKAHMNVQVGTDSVEKVLSSQDGSVVGKQAIGGVEAIKKSGYGGIARSVYSVSLVASFNEKTYLISFYTLDVKNINDYEKSFNEVVPIFKFTQ